MADYSQFPFDKLSTDDVIKMLFASVRISDDEFAEACRNYLMKHKEPFRFVEDGAEWKIYYPERYEYYSGGYRCAVYDSIENVLSNKDLISLTHKDGETK